MRIGLAALFGTVGLVAIGPCDRSVAQTVVSAEDAHTMLVNGQQALPSLLTPDSISTLTRGADGVWRMKATVAAPSSVVGPPTAIGMTPDGHTLFVASASRADPARAAIAPDDRISVIDVTSGRPRLVQTIAAVPGATTPRLTRDGRHLLVAGGRSGRLAWFRFDGRRLSRRVLIDLPGKPGFPAGLAMLPGGKDAMVSLWQGDCVYRLSFVNDGVTVDPAKLRPGSGPWTIRLTPDGRYAAINLLGHGEGRPGGVALVDLRAVPWRVVQTVTVPNAPEGMDIAPDGSALAVVSQNGSAMPPASPLYHARGVVSVFAFDHARLVLRAQAPGTLWPQGLVFTPDGHSIIVQGAADHMLRTLDWNGHALVVRGDAMLPGGGADLERAR